MTTSDTTSSNEWQRVITSDKKWQRVVQRVIANDEKSFRLISLFFFFQIKEESSTKHPMENSLNLE